MCANKETIIVISSPKVNTFIKLRYTMTYIHCSPALQHAQNEQNRQSVQLT